eukprot:CAMPEP_0171326616 /NCGR_PEP_ID=MMETSP0816-20121228/117567_1 /TAXON_ID=420281 /ORGANISM="Proboscia inermis, Strain CCAP1064/1" /LENGTH=568 /DNA_ID=CAMNT_0011826135 /DNA_START=138 /DNA_END=1844 /DNA_ORIENTATION=+
MPKYFKQSKFTSFQRQLNLYGFNRLTRGNDAGGYYHELFLRGKTFICTRLMRVKVNGRGVKGLSNPELEPEFYSMSSCEKDEHMNDNSSVEASHLEDAQHIQPQEVISCDRYECENDNKNSMYDIIPVESTSSNTQHFATPTATKKRRMENILDAITRLPLPPTKRHTSTSLSDEKDVRNRISTTNSTNNAQKPQIHYEHLNRLKELAQKTNSNCNGVSEEEATNNSPGSYLNTDQLLLSQLNLEILQASRQSANLSRLRMLGLGLSNGFSKTSNFPTHLLDRNNDITASTSRNFDDSYRRSSPCSLATQQDLSAEKERKMTSRGDVSRSDQNVTSCQYASSTNNLSNNFLGKYNPKTLNCDSKHISSRASAALKAGRIAMGGIDSFKQQLLRSLGKLTISNTSTLEPMVKEHLLAAWVDELLHFLALKVSINDTCAPSKLVPGKPIVIAWQELMMNPKVYANICKAMLGESSVIDHHPVEETISNEQTSELYSTTWEIYKLCFEVKKPPSLFWPAPKVDEEYSKKIISSGNLGSHLESVTSLRQTGSLNISKRRFPFLSQNINIKGQ